MFVNEELKQVIRKADITECCKIELLQDIEWDYVGQSGEVLLDKRTGKARREHGKVIADYEHYIVVRTPKGYNVCLGKNEIAIKQVRIKGFEPKVPKIYAYECKFNGD